MSAREYMLHLLKLARWVLEVERLVIVGVQSLIDAAVAALSSRPVRPEEGSDGER